MSTWCHKAPGDSELLVRLSGAIFCTNELQTGSIHSMAFVVHCGGFQAVITAKSHPHKNLNDIHVQFFFTVQGFKREWAPFVLTPDFVYVMGGEGSDSFETYKNLCCRAFLILRRHAELIINLFSMVGSSCQPSLGYNLRSVFEYSFPPAMSSLYTC